MELKSEPIDIDIEQAYRRNSSNGSSRRLSGHSDTASEVSSHPVDLTTQPANFLTDQGRPQMVIDPLQEDVIYLPPPAHCSRGHGKDVTEFATYTISHHEAELNSKLLPKKYRCRFCVYKTSYKSDLNRHLRKHGIAPQHCPLCNMPFKTTGNLENHMRQTHPDIASSMGILPSSLSALCVEGSFVSQALAIGALGGVIKFPSSHADVSPRSSELSRQHHHSLRPDLRREFPTLSRAVLSPAQLSCHVCSFICSDSDVLARHLLTHPSEEESSRTPKSDFSPARLACNYCRMIFLSIDELQAHRRSCIDPEYLRARNGRDAASEHYDAVREESANESELEEGLEKLDNFGLPRQETMDKLRRTITSNRNGEANAGSDCHSDSIEVLQPSHRKRESLIMTHVPTAGEGANSVSLIQGRVELNPNLPDSVSDINRSGARANSKAPRANKASEKNSHKSDRIRAAAPADRLTHKQHLKPHKDQGQGEREQSQTRFCSKPLPTGVTRNSTDVKNTLPSRASFSTKPNRAGRRDNLSKNSVVVAGEDSSSNIPDSRISNFTAKERSKLLDKIRDSSNYPLDYLSQSQRHFSNDNAIIAVKEEVKSPNDSFELEGLYCNSPDGRTDLMSFSSSGINDKIGEEVRLMCVLCEKMFGNKSHLITHLQQAHRLSTNSSSCSLGKHPPTSDVTNSNDIRRTGTRGYQYRDSSSRSERAENLKTPRQRDPMISWHKSPTSRVPFGQNSSQLAMTDNDLHSEGQAHFRLPNAGPREGEAPNPPDRRLSGTRVVSEPPSSGRYAKLVSDFDEFSTNPYACALCFFRTARLGELREHVHNHLTGCSKVLVPVSARFRTLESFQVESSTSPIRRSSTVYTAPSSSASGTTSYALGHLRLKDTFEELRERCESVGGCRAVYSVSSLDSQNSTSEEECDRPPVTIRTVSTTVSDFKNSQITVMEYSPSRSCSLTLPSMATRGIDLSTTATSLSKNDTGEIFVDNNDSEGSQGPHEVATMETKEYKTAESDFDDFQTNEQQIKSLAGSLISDEGRPTDSTPVPDNCAGNKSSHPYRKNSRNTMNSPNVARVERSPSPVDSSTGNAEDSAGGDSSRLIISLETSGVGQKNTDIGLHHCRLKRNQNHVQANQKSKPKVPKKRNVGSRDAFLRSLSNLKIREKNRCSKCGKMFSLRRLLVGHKRFSHGISAARDLI